MSEGLPPGLPNRCSIAGCDEPGLVPKIRLPGNLGEVALPDDRLCLTHSLPEPAESVQSSPLKDLVAKALKLKGPWGVDVDPADPSIVVTFSGEWG